MDTVQVGSVGAGVLGLLYTLYTKFVKPWLEKRKAVKPVSDAQSIFIHKPDEPNAAYLANMKEALKALPVPFQLACVYDGLSVTESLLKWSKEPKTNEG